MAMIQNLRTTARLTTLQTSLVRATCPKLDHDFNKIGIDELLCSTVEP